MNAVVPLNVTALRVSSTDRDQRHAALCGPHRRVRLPAARRGREAGEHRRHGLAAARERQSADRRASTSASTCTGSCRSTSSAGPRTPTPARSASRTRRPAGSSCGRSRPRRRRRAAAKRWIVESDYVSPTLPPDPDDPTTSRDPRSPCRCAPSTARRHVHGPRRRRRRRGTRPARQDQDYLPAYTGRTGSRCT